MIESIEGKRGMPRLRPPYVAQVGLFGYPTLEHNMETVYWVRDILEKGPEWFAGFGRNGRKGLRSFSVSGRVKKPGVHLAPAGITVRELIDEYCGGMLDGHTLLRLPAGRRVGRHPAGVDGATCRSTSTRCNQYGCFIGSAAVVILSDQDRASDAARNLIAVLHGRILRPVHALPRGHGEGARADGSGRSGTRPLLKELSAGDDGRVHLRARAGGAEPGADA